MKLKIILIIGLILLYGCAQSTLKQAEMDLIQKLNFDPELLAIVKKSTDSSLQQLPAIDQETGDILNDQFFNGICAGTTEEKGFEIVRKLKSTFKEKGYLVFLFEGDNYESYVAVIKGTDELDILRYRRTDGINYDLENEDIITKISEWKSKYGLIVLGCGRDWVNVEFDKLPADMDAFANEVYEFCPDTVEQGTETVAKLKQAIRALKGVQLWWD